MEIVLLKGVNNKIAVNYKELANIIPYDIYTNFLKEKGFTLEKIDKKKLMYAFLGKKYKRGSKNTDTTVDCSLLVKKIYGEIGIWLPRISYD